MFHLEGGEAAEGNRAGASSAHGGREHGGRGEHGNWEEPGWLRWIQRGAVLVLVVSALFKVMGVIAGHPLLQDPDPLLYRLTRGQLALAAAVFEGVVAVGWWRSRQAGWRLFWLTWVTAVFISYRGGLWMVGYRGICPCLGATLNAWTGSALAEDRVAAWLFAYLVGATSLGMAQWGWRRVKWGRGVAVWAGLSGVFFAGVPSSEAGQTTIATGNIRWYVSGQAKTNEPFRQWKFRVAMSPEAWSVRTTLMQSGSPGLNSFCYGNGEFLFSLVQGTPAEAGGVSNDELEAKLREAGFEGVKVVNRPSFDSSACYMVRSAPLYRPDGVAPLWLALCSESYLRSSRKDIQPVFDMGTFDRSVYPVQGLVAYMDGAPGLPRRIDFRNEGKEMVPTVPLPGRDFLLQPYPAPYDQGFTNAVYEALESATRYGQVLPLRFKLTCWVPDKNSRRGMDFLELWHYDAAILAVESSDAPVSMVPDFQVSLTRVADGRMAKHLNGAEMPCYTATNGVWLSEMQANVHPAVVRFVKDHPPAGRGSAIWALLVILVFIVFPSSAYLYFRKNTASQGNPQMS